MLTEEKMTMVFRIRTNTPNNVIKSVFSEISDMAEEMPNRILYTEENWIKELGSELIVETPIGQVKVGDGQFNKMKAKDRTKYWYLLKPTLNKPSFIVQENDAKNYIKAFRLNNNTKWFMAVSVSIDKVGQVNISSYRIDENRAISKIKNNPVIYVAPENQGAMLKLHDWMTNGSNQKVPLKAGLVNSLFELGVE